MFGEVGGFLFNELSRIKMIKNSIYYGGSKIFAAANSFILTIYYSYNIKSDYFSEYVLSLVTVNVLNLSFFNWVRQSMIRDLAGNSSGYFNYFFVTLALSCFFCLLTALVFNFLELSFPALTVGMLFICVINDFFLDVMRSKFQARTYAFHYVGRQLMISAIAVLLIYEDSYAPLHYAYLFGVAAPLVFYPVSFFAVIKDINFSIQKIKKIILDGFWLIPNYVVSSLMNNVDKYIVIMVLGKSIGGAYALVVDLTRQTVMVAMEAANLALYPEIAKKINKGGDVAYAFLINISLLMIVGGGVSAALFFGSEIIAINFIGPDYREHAKNIMPLIAMATLFRGIRVYYYDQAYQVYKKNKSLAKNSFFSLIFMTIAYYFGVSQGDIFFAAAANFSTFLFSLIIGALGSRIFFNYWLPARVFGKYILFFVVVLLFAFRYNPFVVGILFFVLYFIFCGALFSDVRKLRPQ